MALSTNVVRRKGSRQYYARLAVPKELQKRLRKRELWKSLGTTDPHEAKRRVRPILDQWEREFAEIRKPRALTEAELQDAVWKRYLELLTEGVRGSGARCQARITLVLLATPRERKLANTT